MNSKLFFAIASIGIAVTQITMFVASSYYIPLILFILCYFLYKGGFSLDLLTTLFLLATLLSILGNDIPPFFKPWQRLVQLVLVMVCVSSINKSERVAFYREALMLNLCVVSAFIMLLNFLSYYGGFGQSTHVGFWGVCYHGNLLGMFSMIGIVYMLHLFLCEEHKIRRIIYMCCLLVGIVVLLLASSRNTLACAIIGGAVYIKLFYKSNSRIITAGIVLGILYVLIAPFFEEYTYGLAAKNSEAATLGSITSSRDALWATRLAEFWKSPLIGVGAFAVDTSIQNSEKFFNPYNSVTGVVELGSTYLGILSQTGLLGFIAFIMLLVKAIRNGYRAAMDSMSKRQILMFTLLVMFSFHMIFEGYVNTAGQLLTLLLWLILACNIQPSNEIDEIENKRNFLYY